MQEAFGIVLVVVVVLAALAALVNWLASGDSAYEQIGRGGLSLRDGTDPPARDEPPAVAAAVRDEEIRQMLEARNARRLRQGKEPLDVDAQLRELERPAPDDPALAAEVRQLVVARNARRERQGKPALDVEAEVARRLRDLQSG